MDPVGFASLNSFLKWDYGRYNPHTNTLSVLKHQLKEEETLI